jgi:hypothetical protein
MEPDVHDTTRTTALDSLQWKGSGRPSDEFFPKEIFQNYRAGETYVDSPAYLLQMIAMIGQYWVPEKKFYDLLLLSGDQISI